MAYAMHREFAQPLGCNPNFCVDTEMTLILRDQLFYINKPFMIMNEKGVNIMKCRGNSLSISHRKGMLATYPVFSWIGIF